MTNYLGWRIAEVGGGRSLYSKLFRTNSLASSLALFDKIIPVILSENYSGRTMFLLDKNSLSVSLIDKTTSDDNSTLINVIKHTDVVAGELHTKHTSASPATELEVAERVSSESSLRSQALQWLNEAADWKIDEITPNHTIAAKTFSVATPDASLLLCHKVAKMAYDELLDDVVLVADPNKVQIFLHLYGEGALPEAYAALIERINVLSEA